MNCQFHLLSTKSLVTLKDHVFYAANTLSQQAHDVIITSSWRQIGVATSFWRHNIVIIALCVRCLLKGNREKKFVSFISGRLYIDQTDRPVYLPYFSVSYLSLLKPGFLWINLTFCLICFFQISVDRLENRLEIVEVLEKYIEKPHYKEIYVDLVSRVEVHPSIFSLWSILFKQVIVKYLHVPRELSNCVFRIYQVSLPWDCITTGFIYLIH